MNEKDIGEGGSNLQINQSVQLSLSLSSLEEKDLKIENDHHILLKNNKSQDQLNNLTIKSFVSNSDYDRSSICTVSSSDSTHLPQIHPRSSSKTEGRMRVLDCDMCNNYEIQLQEVQCREGNLLMKMIQHENAVKNAREELKKEQAFRNELEEKYNEEAKKTSLEIEKFHERIDNDRRRLTEIITKFNSFEHQTNDVTNQLIQQSDTLKKELERLKNENEILLGKHIAKSEEMLSEKINIPENLDELQIYCLTLRENLIEILVSREEIEKKLTADNLHLKERLQSELNSRESLEENLQQEIEVLNNQLDRKKKEVSELKKRLGESNKQLELSNAQSLNSGEKLSKYDSQIQELLNYKTKAEEDLQNLRNKVTSLQIELDNSEEVQKDFVKLSQSLQVQLENIRQADSEVRWQHEDDVTECTNCKKIFHSKKEKANCRHCGRIFCSECLSKIIISGPNNRQNKVCNVCHTLLDKQTACWFVNEPPKSPT